LKSGAKLVAILKIALKKIKKAKLPTTQIQSLEKLKLIGGL
jgi:hypothetical protein